MGRETKLLLGLLATLLGVFFGVLSMKLLVPRPPVGAGPDVHADVAATEPHDLVDPPRLEAEPTPPAGAEEAAPPRSRFAAASTPAEAVPAARDPFVTPSSFEQPAAQPPDLPAADPRPPLAPPDPQVAGTAGDLAPPAGYPARLPADAVGELPPTAGSSYAARPGDSWWSLAERLYGDGRFYRALFAWNRTLDPRVSLVPGTALELPTRDRLEAAWPALVPRP